MSVPAGLTSVETRSLRERVRDSIRDGILAGVFKPGERLVEVRLARQLNVSQGTVREALRELEVGGLLVTSRHRGTFVRSLSPREVGEVYTLRAHLERLAVRLAVARVTAEDLATLRGLFEAMRGAAAGGDIDLLCRLDVEFHLCLVTLADHSLLVRSWVAINPTIWTFLTLAKLSNLSPLDIALRHEPILAAFEAGDAAAAEAAIDQHILPLGAEVVRGLHATEDEAGEVQAREEKVAMP